MVKTRAEKTMDRTEFEKLTLEQLRKEASKYGLPTEGSKSTLIDAIITHLAEHGPIEELLQTEVVPTEPTVFSEKEGSLAKDNESCKGLRTLCCR